MSEAARVFVFDVWNIEGLITMIKEKTNKFDCKWENNNLIYVTFDKILYTIDLFLPSNWEIQFLIW